MGSCDRPAAARGLVDAIAHVGRGIVRIPLQLEHDGDARLLGAARRGHVVHALDAGDRVLDGLGDLRLDDGSVRAGYEVFTDTTGVSMFGT
jgi:hypothetical protein